MADVTATFRILDRASGSLRDIRREAERTDRALLRAGASADLMGGQRAQQSYANAERGLQRVNNQMGKNNALSSIFLNRWVMITGAVLAGASGVSRLAGVVVQLAGSLVQAAGGAGVIGGGALGAFAVGLGSVLLLVKGMSSDLKTSQRLLTAYNQAVNLYGRNSRQAALHAERLNAALKKAPAGTLQLLTGVRALGREWDRTTTKAQGYLMTLAASAVGRARGVLPQVSGFVTANARAVASAGGGVLDRLLSTGTMQQLAALSADFRRDLPPAADAATNLLLTMLRLAHEAAPFVTSFLRQFDGWTKRLSISTADVSYMTGKFGMWVDQFRRWLALGGAMIRFLGQLFTQARGGGREISGITRQFNAWTLWLRDNPLKVARFFQQSSTLATQLGKALLYVFRLFASASSTLGGVWQTITSLIGALSGPLLVLFRQLVVTVGLLGGGLAGLGSPIAFLLRGLGGILSLVNTILRHVPLLGAVLSTALAGLGIVKMVTWMGRFVGLIPRAQSEMQALTAATLQAAGATERLASVGAATGVAGVARGAAAADMSLGAMLFPGRGRAAGFASRVFGSRGQLQEVPGTSTFGGDYPVIVGSRGPLGALSRFASRSSGIRAAESAAGGAGMFARVGRGAAGLLGRAGGVAGPLAIGTMLASSLLPRSTPGFLSGAAQGASLGSLGMFLGPEVGLPAMAVGAILGGVLGSGPGDPTGAYTTTVGGRRVMSPRGGGMLVGGRTVQHASLAADLARQGGGDPRTSAQIQAQIRSYNTFIGRARGDQSVESQLLQQRALLRSILPQVRGQERHAQFTHAYGLGQQLMGGFNVINQAQGPVAAMEFVRKQALARWARLGPEGQQVLAHGLLSWANQMRQTNPVLTGQFEALKNSVIGKMVAVQGVLRQVGQTILTGAAPEWQRIAAAMVNPIEQAREQITSKLTLIQQKAVASLEQMGASPSVAMHLVSQIESGGIQASAVKPIDFVRRARGGRIPGEGLNDTLAYGGALVAPGEVVVNRHAEQRINAMLGQFGTSLMGMVHTTDRPHSYPMRKLAYGGVTGSPLSGLRPGVRAVAQTVLDRFPGLSVTSTLRSQDKGSYHAIGEAVDLAGPGMNKAAAWIGRNMIGSLLEGIHNPNLSIKNMHRVPSSFWGASTWAAHANHIHLAAGALSRGALGQAPGRGAGGVSLAQLYPGATALPGVPGALVDWTGLIVTAATQRRLNAILGGGGSGAGVGSSPTTATGARLLGQRMAAARGWTGAQWSALDALWTGESNWNPLARNPSSGAFGIPQSLPASKMGPAGMAGNARAQIAWGLGYIGGRYGSPSNAYAQWSARSPHWYGRGGKFVARRPQLIGVGDGGAEEVTVRPLRSGGGGGGSITIPVTIHRIDATRGDEEIVNRIRDAFAEVADELMRAGFAPEENLTR